MLACSQSAAAAYDGEAERRDLVQKKWDRLNQHQDELQARHSAGGGSLDFTGRLNRLQALLIEDVKEAYQKAVAAELGLKEVFGLDMPLPPIAG